MALLVLFNEVVKGLGYKIWLEMGNHFNANIPINPVKQ